MFITFEGTEGSGKTTVIHHIKDALEHKGLKVITTREPGSGPMGQKLRDLLLGDFDIKPKTELFLFLADRAQHVEEIIQPALNEGKLVLCDRYIDSTIVYQGYSRGFDLNLLRSLNEFATHGLKPSYTFLLDIDPHLGLKRQSKRDRLDLEPMDFHQCVRKGFLTEAQLDPNRFKIIDASLPLNQVLDVILKEILIKV